MNDDDVGLIANIFWVILTIFILVFLVTGCATKNKEWTPKNIYESIERAENRNY